MTSKYDLFKEQLEALALCYPADRITINDSHMRSWWPIFKGFEVCDMLKGFIACREEQQRRFPSAGILEDCMKKAQTERSRQELDLRLEKHSDLKTQTLKYRPRDLNDPREKEIVRDIFAVFKIGVTPERWRILAEKYRDVPSHHLCNFGNYFEAQAEKLEKVIQRNKALRLKQTEDKQEKRRKDDVSMKAALVELQGKSFLNPKGIAAKAQIESLAPF